jgi:hypothetical protein
MFTPFTITSPVVGTSILFTHRSNVDFPAPLGPITITISPGITSQSMRSTTGISTNTFDTPRIRRRALVTDAILAMGGPVTPPRHGPA